MNPARVQNVLVTLLAAMTLCTTILIVLAIARSRAAAARPSAPGIPGTPGTSAPETTGTPAGAPVRLTALASPATRPSDPSAEQAMGSAGSDDHAAAAANAPPPVLFNAPAFKLIEASGKPLALGDLRGKAWIADFVFTRCGSICPRMTAVMGQLQGQLQKRADWSDIRLVSFSVDPDHDTPEVLREYAKSWSAEAGHWLFLTGERKVIWPMVRNGFKLPVEDATADANSDSPILHSGKFVLVDRAGRIRGYYTGFEEDGRQALLAALDRVLAEPAPAQTQPGK